MNSEDLPDPDTLGSAEYRAIHEMLTDNPGADPLSILEEFQQQAASMRERLGGAIPAQEITIGDRYDDGSGYCRRVSAYRHENLLEMELWGDRMDGPLDELDWLIESLERVRNSIRP